MTNIFEQLDRLVDIHGMMYDEIDTIDAAKNRIETLEDALRKIADFVSSDDREFYHYALEVACAALKGIEA